ncbi:hypothetical protein HPB49_000079 [Dermacentor silvarum]|uniref:Uncharacterized protein n=1 Tax=Dermacentor silvarum TaxID=543639 RepID=A0ACB8DRV5_DERSI|nr:hypothetical protein HPB49_000079 [Dermacentor silvarum]
MADSRLLHFGRSITLSTAGGRLRNTIAACASVWHGSLGPDMRPHGRRDTWSLLRVLLDPTHTKASQRKDISRLLHSSPLTDTDFLAALHDRYLCTDPPTTLPAYTGSPNPELEADISLGEVLSLDGTPLPLVSTLRILGLFLQSNGKHTILITRLTNTEDKVNSLIRQAYKSSALSLPTSTSTARLLSMGVHNSLTELTEAHRTAQLLRLSRTRPGRALLSTLKLSPLTPLPTSLPIPSHVYSLLTVHPLPKNMHPEHHPSRRAARASALWRQYERQPAVAYVDATPYRRYPAHALAVVDNSFRPTLTASHHQHLWRHLQAHTLLTPARLALFHPGTYSPACRLCGSSRANYDLIFFSGPAHLPPASWHLTIFHHHRNFGDTSTRRDTEIEMTNAGVTRSGGVTGIESPAGGISWPVRKAERESRDCLGGCGVGGAGTSPFGYFYVVPASLLSGGIFGVGHIDGRRVITDFCGGSSLFGASVFESSLDDSSCSLPYCPIRASIAYSRDVRRSFSRSVLLMNVDDRVRAHAALSVVVSQRPSPC